MCVCVWVCHNCGNPVFCFDTNIKSELYLNVDSSIIEYLDLWLNVYYSFIDTKFHLYMSVCVYCQDGHAALKPW